jgi:hypothetical protein
LWVSGGIAGTNAIGDFDLVQYIELIFRRGFPETPQTIAKRHWYDLI